MNIEIKISNRLIPYKKAINILENRVKEIKNGDKSDFLWILEHPLTYTAGIRSSKNDVLDKKINLISTNRGGKITLHNSGQKIIYFAINLNKKKRDIRKFITMIENCIIEFLKLYNIDAKADKKNIGVWTKKKK